MRAFPPFLQTTNRLRVALAHKDAGCGGLGAGARGGGGCSARANSRPSSLNLAVVPMVERRAPLRVETSASPWCSGEQPPNWRTLWLWLWLRQAASSKRQAASGKRQGAVAAAAVVTAAAGGTLEPCRCRWARLRAVTRRRLLAVALFFPHRRAARTTSYTHYYY